MAATGELIVKVPQPLSVEQLPGSSRVVVLRFERPVSENEMRALRVLGQGGFPSVSLAPEEMRG